MKLVKVVIWMTMLDIQKNKHEAKDDVVKLLEVVDKTNEKYKSKDLVNVIDWKC